MTARIDVPNELPSAVAFNHGKAWTPKDESLLREAFLDGTSMIELCRKFGRQPGGILGRLQYMSLIAYDGRGGYTPNRVISPQPQVQTLEPTMAKLIESKTLILGREAETMSDSEIFKLIAKTESELVSLKTIRTPSKKLEAHIAKTEAELKRLAEYVDSREEA